jgi:hypothetical protein
LSVTRISATRSRSELLAIGRQSGHSLRGGRDGGEEECRVKRSVVWNDDHSVLRIQRGRRFVEFNQAGLIVRNLFAPKSVGWADVKGVSDQMITGGQASPQWYLVVAASWPTGPLRCDATISFNKQQRDEVTDAIAPYLSAHQIAPLPSVPAEVQRRAEKSPRLSDIFRKNTRQFE